MFLNLTTIILLWLFVHTTASSYDVTTFVLENAGSSERKDRGGVSLVYGCTVRNEVGPCVDTPELCTNQGGKLVGYCFYEGKYEGVCCPGLDPAKATLTTTSAPNHDIQEDNSTTTTTKRPGLFPGFPTMTTQQTTNRTYPTLFPNVSMTTHTPTTNRTYPSFPNLTMTTEAMPNRTEPSFPNITMTTPVHPNMTAPTFPNRTTEATTVESTTPTSPETTVEQTETSPSDETTIEDSTTELSTEAAPPEESTTEAPPSTEVTVDASTESSPETSPSEDPSTEPPTSAVVTIHFDESQTEPITTELIPTGDFSPPPALYVPAPPEQVGCSTITSEIESSFSNPSYPSYDAYADVYKYTIMPLESYCGLRIQFLEAVFAGKGEDGCSTDSVSILTNEDTPTTPLCGLLKGYELSVQTYPEQPVKIAITTQSHAHMWKINLTQINCNNIRAYQDYEDPDCGIKNLTPSPLGLAIDRRKEIPRVVSSDAFLKKMKEKLPNILAPTQNSISPKLRDFLRAESSIKLVQGNETGINEHPWQALLLVYGRPLCGASLLNDEWLVTAGQCVQSTSKYPLVSVLTVDLGDHNLMNSKETTNTVVKVSKIVLNAENSGVRNDIALIKLARKLKLGKTFRPVCLPNKQNPLEGYTGQMAVTTGWGKTETSVLSSVLRETELEIISKEECRQGWSAVGAETGSLIEEGMICVGASNTGRCNIDSGGPLVLYDRDEHKWRLIGLTSFGQVRGCAIQNVPLVFTKVTTYLDWIALNLAKA